MEGLSRWDLEEHMPLQVALQYRGPLKPYNTLCADIMAHCMISNYGLICCMTSEVKKKTISPWLIVVSITLCCTIVNKFRATKSMRLCLSGGDFSFAAQLQETWTFVFSRPHTIGKEVGVEMRAEIKWIWGSLYCVQPGNRRIVGSPLSGMLVEFSTQADNNADTCRGCFSQSSVLTFQGR